MASSLLNQPTTSLKHSNFWKIKIRVFTSFGILKSPLRFCLLLGGYSGIDSLLRIIFLGDKSSLTMTYALYVKLNPKLHPICSSLAIKCCHCGGNSSLGLRKAQFYIIVPWLIFFTPQLQLEERILLEEGRLGGWLLQSQSGNPEMTWCFTIRRLIFIS